MAINPFECYSEGDNCENQAKGVERTYMVHTDKTCLGSELTGTYCVQKVITSMQIFSIRASRSSITRVSPSAPQICLFCRLGYL